VLKDKKTQPVSMKRFILTVMLSILAASIRGETQIKPAVKTNVLYDAFLNVNLGVEIKVARRWSLDLSGDYNGWKISGNRQWKHWLIQPEARYWTKEAMNGHFFAAHLLGGQFNTAFSSTRRQGWGVGAGVGYGYSRRLGSNWGLEAEIAAGYLRYGYDKYPCAQCGRKTGSRNRNYVGPTKAAVNLVYYFGQSKKEKPVAEVAGHQITPDETTNKPAPPPTHCQNQTP